MAQAPEALTRWLQTRCVGIARFRGSQLRTSDACKPFCRLERAFPDGGWAVGVVVDALSQQSEAKAVQDTIDVRPLSQAYLRFIAPPHARPCRAVVPGRQR